jgi:hypothetical protein
VSADKTAPDPKAFEDPLGQALAVLNQLSLLEGSTGWASAGAISRALRDEHRIGLHWRTIDALFHEARNLVTRRKRGGRWEYRLLAAGQHHLQSKIPQFLLIEPQRALQGVRTVHAVFGGLRGTVRLCDPYFDPTSIEHLAAIPKGAVIRVLTVNVKDPNTVRRHLSAARTEGRNIEVRVMPPGTLHDRYLIDDSQFFILGTSLNGLGKKQSFLIAGGADIRAAMLGTFDAQYASQVPWI